MKVLPSVLFTSVAITMTITATSAQADLDRHGPDAWRVTGVSENDLLNARMGPGTNYPVLETFAHNERGMQQITCVPFYTAAHYERMTQAQIDALPQRWCLMRDAAMSKAGWVAQRFITPDATVATSKPDPSSGISHSSQTAYGDAMITEAEWIVRDLYEATARSERGEGHDPLQGPSAARYFISDIVGLLQSGSVGAHPLYGAQDFDGQILHIAPDPEQPMLRGMITIHVDFTNFGMDQRAVFLIRADTTKPGAPLRIFRVEHDGWAYP